MLFGITSLLLCQLAGEVLAKALAVPIPGPVFGMLLLFALMLVHGPLVQIVKPAANGLLANLSLLFVPAGTGVVQHLDLLGTSGLRIVVVLVVSTVASLAVTALTFAWAAKLLGVDGTQPDKDAAS
jgi:holin-like protein